MSRNLSGMQSLGWIRYDSTVLQRGRRLSLTPAGSRMLIRMREVWMKAQAMALA